MPAESWCLSRDLSPLRKQRLDPFGVCRGCRVLLEPECEIRAKFGFVALGVKGRPAALWGRERDPALFATDRDQAHSHPRKVVGGLAEPGRNKALHVTSRFSIPFRLVREYGAVNSIHPKALRNRCRRTLK
jgi:hypothetical protein